MTLRTPDRTTSPGRPLAWALIGLTLASAPAWAKDDLPPRKPGLWAMQMQMAGMPAGMGDAQHCVDAATDAALQAQSLSGDGEMQCQQRITQRGPGLVLMQADCTGPEGKAHMDARITGDMRTSYRMDNKISFTPPRDGLREANMVVQARHLGACPAGMKPGDIRMANGMVMNPSGGQAGGMDLSALKNMSPEQLKQMAEQMKRMHGGGKP